MTNKKGEGPGAPPYSFEEAGLYCYRYALMRSHADGDLAGDFYLYMVPRLHRLFSRYVDQGKTLLHYVASVCKWQWKSFMRNVSKESLRSMVTVSAAAAHFEPEGEKQGPIPCIIGLKESGASIRRGLLYTAVAHPGLSEEKLEAVSAITGVPTREIQDAADRLRKQNPYREKMMERAASAYSILLNLDYGIQKEVDPEKKAKLVQKRQRARNSLHVSVRKSRLSKIAPSHAEVASVLGVPKGTVDSSVYWLQRAI